MSTLLQEWRLEEFEKTKVDVIGSMHRVLVHCQRQDKDLWPEAVTVAFQSALPSAPHVLAAEALSPVQSPMPAAQQPSGATQAASVGPAYEDQDIFSQLRPQHWYGLIMVVCLVNSMCALSACCQPTCLCRFSSASIPCYDSATAANSAVSPDCITHQPCKSSESCTPSELTALWKWFNQLYEFVPRFAVSSLDKEKLQVKVVKQTAGCAQQRHKDEAAIIHITAVKLPSLHQHEADQQLRVQSACPRLTSPLQQPIKQGLTALQQQGCPWPCMQITRRSALRWHVSWHGLLWPADKELPLNLDSHY